MDTAPVPTDALPAGPQALAVASLLDAFQNLVDPRKARGIRYSLSGTLALCVVAFICGHQNLSGVRRFGQAHPALLKALGFARERAPSVPTLSRLLGAVDLEDFQCVIGSWLSVLIASARRRKGLAAASIDGKTKPPRKRKRKRENAAEHVNRCVFIAKYDRINIVPSAWGASASVGSLGKPPNRSTNLRASLRFRYI